MRQKPTVLAREIVASSRLFRVEELQLRFANGVERTYERLVGKGTYINYLDPLQEDWAQTSYRQNLRRLRAVARRYDPDRVLRFAQSVH